MEHEHLLLCDGSSFDTTKYVLLAELFPNGKLPDLNGRFLQGSTTAGQMIEAGLPNIVGQFVGAAWYGVWGTQRGPFYQRNENPQSVDLQWGTTIDNGIHSTRTSFDASKANAVYGKSNTVQPPSYTVKYYICYGG